jgi:SAM-dependent methyltransferase
VRRRKWRRVFGTDPAGYASGRPGYPAELFDALEHRCGLAPGTPTLEIGPGGGQATVELLARGAAPLVVVEPDPELSRFLGDRFGDAVEIRTETFEDAELDTAAFDLAASATAFHWVDQEIGLAHVARVLTPGGWWAAWWSAYHDPDRPDALYDALGPILEPLPSAYRSTTQPSVFSFDREARVADLRATGSFETVTVETFRWTLPLDGPRARALFGTFSPVLALPTSERRDVLDRIEAVLDEEFGGRYDRSCVTILYTARRL